MKYRILTRSELEPLEKDFIEFLVVNGITAEDYQKIQEEDPEKREKLIALFSEVVFESIFRKQRYLEIRTPGFIHAYQCLDNKMILAGISTENPEINLEKVSLSSLATLPGGALDIFITEKTYNEKREREMYEMTQKGCRFSDGELFKRISLAYMDNKHD